MHYLDNSATTRVREEAAQAALNAMTEGWGNPSSQYAFGTKAAKEMKGWHADVAAGLGCAPEEVTFISCGSEGDNWAIQAAVEMGRRKGKHIITTAIEHDAVLAPCKKLQQQGYEVTYLSPDREGNISIADVEKALRPDTILVSMMLVNNEVGSILPVAETAAAIKKAGSPALLHCDAVQAFLKIPFRPADLGVDMLSVSGHKIHAPKGVGAMYIRKGLNVPPLIMGGGQENGLRSGTEPTAQMAAMAAAVRAGLATAEQDMAHMAELKAYAIGRIEEEIPQAKVLAKGGAPHILPVSLVGYRSEVLVRFLSDLGVYVSSGSACHRGKPSHVFSALRLQKKETDGALRVSFTYDTSREDIDALVEGLKSATATLVHA